MKTPKATLIRLGALVDGEGTISLQSHNSGLPGSNGKKYPCHLVLITLSNTAKSMVLEFQKVFGGNICDIPAKKINHKRQYRWSLVCKRAADTIRTLLPYLVQKRRQAEVVLEFQTWQLCRKPHLQKARAKVRSRLLRKVRRLNQRGTKK